MTEYAEFMEEFLEPRDKDKVSRYHRLLDEEIYPFSLDYLGWACAKVVKEINARIFEGPIQPDYHWWVYLNTFSMWDKYDMAFRAR